MNFTFAYPLLWEKLLSRHENSFHHRRRLPRREQPNVPFAGAAACSEAGSCSEACSGSCSGPDSAARHRWRHHSGL